MVVKLSVHRYESITRVIRIFSSMCGADVLDPKYRVNLLTWIVLTFINTFFCCTTYTMYINVYVDRDLTKVLQTLCLVGSALQGYVKLVNAIWNQHNLRFLTEELHRIYAEYDEKQAHYRRKLSKSVNLVVKVIKFVFFSYFINVSLFLMAVPVYGIIYKEKIFIMQMFIPGLDHTTDFGYYLLISIQLILMLFGGFGTFAADTFLINFITHVPMLKDILRCKFEDLNEALDDENKERTKKYKAILRDILQWHQKYMLFITIIKDTYFWVILVQMTTVGLNIASTLFVVISAKWPSGPPYMIFCFCTLYIYCGLGTVVENANEDVIYSSYTDVNWYHLPPSEKKMLGMMLMMAQNTSGLTVGVVVPLSVSTGLQLTKAIYTWSMMLINFID
ncbi:odorant receptor 67d-like [Stomoxys calcitrans]|uniref:odorant receptor 67d-like n=1 Tax=Stomoxys calcitrans TaxID=35570 RepID=UPI0027E2D578|nr:odorant receptor 67d-like [Stomoxys calcitrans]